MITPLRILVADDNQMIRTLLRMQLQADGHQVTLAEHGREALKLTETDPPDLLVLDIVMPGVDGLEVTRYIREESETPDLPIVLLTGRDTDHDIMVGWRSGANYYITKPLVIDQLRYFIRMAHIVPRTNPVLVRRGVKRQ